MNEPLINSRRLTKHGYVSEFCLYIIFCVSNYQWSQTLEGGCNKKHRVVQCDIIKCCIVNYMATVSVSMVVYCAGSFLGSNSCCPVSMCLLKRRKKKKKSRKFSFYYNKTLFLSYCKQQRIDLLFSDVDI